MDKETADKFYETMAKAIMYKCDSMSLYFLCNLLMSVAIKHDDERMANLTVSMCAKSLENLYKDLRNSGNNHVLSIDICHQIPSVAKKVAGFTEEDYIRSGKFVDKILSEKGYKECSMEDIEKDINIMYDIKKKGIDPTVIQKEVTKEEFDKFFNNTNNEDTSNEDDTSNN